MGPGGAVRAQAAVERARRLVAEGADIIDVGGQSTRPGAARLGPEEELARVVPVLDALRADAAVRASGALVSIDTFHGAVVREAAARGAVDLVNDVSSGRLDPTMFAEVARSGLPYVMMHMRGDPTTMQVRVASAGRALHPFREQRVTCKLPPAGSAGNASSSVRPADGHQG